MDAKNLTWEQIKELADMAMKAGNDFSLMMEADGDCTLKISSNNHGFTIKDTSTPGITWSQKILNQCSNK